MRRTLCLAALVAVLAVLLPAVPAGAQALVLTATTGEATDVARTSATLTGSVDPGLNPSASYAFEYGTTTGYGNRTPVGRVSSATAVSAAVAGLDPATTYHFRIVAEGGLETARGADRTFTTAAAPPVVVTGGATRIGPTRAFAGGTVDPQGLETTYQVEWGTTTAYGAEGPVPPASAGAGEGPVDAGHELTGLLPRTTYHYRLKATNAHGTTFGADRTFVTAPPAPGVSTGPARDVTPTSAVLTGSVDPQGLQTTYRFELGETTAYGQEVPSSPATAGTGDDAVRVSEAVSGLEEGTTYHYRLVATNASGTTYGADRTVRAAPRAPVATTGAATDVGQSGATLTGTVDPRGSATTYRFEIGTTTAYGSRVPVDPAPAGGESAPRAVSEAVAGLAPGTTYHYRLVATSLGGTSSGEDATFTTTQASPPAPPGLATGAALSVTATTASVGGTVRPAAAAVSYAFAYGLTPAYGLRTERRTVPAGTSEVAVTEELAGLEPGTTYHYQLVGVDDRGLSALGGDRTFTTIVPPARRAPRRVLLAVDPEADRRGPLRLQVRGRVGLPEGMDDDVTCKGNVRIRVKQGRRTLATALAPLDDDCAYAAVVVVRRVKGARGVLKVASRFAGNDLLEPRAGEVEKVRFRRSRR